MNHLHMSFAAFTELQELLPQEERLPNKVFFKEAEQWFKTAHSSAPWSRRPGFKRNTDLPQTVVKDFLGHCWSRNMSFGRSMIRFTVFKTLSNVHLRLLLLQRF